MKSRSSSGSKVANYLASRRQSQLSQILKLLEYLSTSYPTLNQATHFFLTK